MVFGVLGHLPSWVLEIAPCKLEIAPCVALATVAVARNAIDMGAKRSILVRNPVGPHEVRIT